MKIRPKIQQSEGFALLLTLIVVTVVIAIGLSVLDLTIRQVRLSTNAKDSEVAFHAANAGMECAQYVRRSLSDSMESGGAINPSCFDGTRYINDRFAVGSGVSGDGDVYRYEYAFTWSEGGVPRCSWVNTIVMAADLGGSNLTLNNVSTYIAGYPGTSKVCDAGTTCTIISAQGYNRSCGSTDTSGTVSREVLLQF